MVYYSAIYKRYLKTKYHKVYAIYCPINFIPVYIGVTHQLLSDRLHQHKKSHNEDLLQFINELAILNKKPIIRLIIRTKNRDRAFEVERETIDKYVLLGFSLFNKFTGPQIDRTEYYTKLISNN